MELRGDTSSEWSYLVPSLTLARISSKTHGPVSTLTLSHILCIPSTITHTRRTTITHTRKTSANNTAMWYLELALDLFRRHWLVDAVDLVDESESSLVSQRDMFSDSTYTLSFFFCGWIMGVTFCMNSDWAADTSTACNDLLLSDT